MKTKLSTSLLSTLVFLLLTSNLFGQNVVITDDDTYTSTSANALLEIKPGSNDKGILIPRLTTVQRNAMTMNTTNDKGIMVYDTDTKSFWYYDGSGWVEIGASSSGMTDSDGDTKIQVEESADEDKIRFDVAGIEAMVIDENGDVKIGGVSPYSNLEISAFASVSLLLEADNDNIDEGDHPQLIFSQDGGIVKTYLGNFNSENAFSIIQNYNDDLKFFTDSTQRFTIKGNGNVGIGTSTPTNELSIDGNADFTGNVGIGTSSPSNAQLQIEGSDTYDGMIRINNTGTNGASFFMGSTNDSWSAGNNKFIMGHGSPSSSNVDLAIDEFGNVGIGTSDPSEKLEVNGAVKIGAYTLPSTDGTNGQFLKTDGSGNVSWSADNNSWTENSGDIYRTSGNVGIGTNTPSNKLSVDGDADFTGNVGIGTTTTSGLFHVFAENTYVDVVDQQNLYSNYGTSGYDQWQSFTAGVSSELSKVSLYKNGYSNSTHSIQIYSGVGTSGTLLATEIVYTSVTGWFTTTFSVPTNVTENQQYTLRIITTSGASNLLYNDGNPYPGGHYYSSDYGLEYGSDLQFIIYVISGDPDRNLIFTSDGYVGIGTTTPGFPLEVSGYAAESYTGYGYLTDGGAGTYSGTYNNYVSIKASDRIAALKFTAYSDQRIKINIRTSNTMSDLEKVNQLRLANYQFIDSIAKGNQLQKGFIAQEVEKVLPEAVNQHSEFIPDIFVLANKVEKFENKIRIEIPKNHYLQKGNFVRLISSSGKIETEVLNIISEKCFTIKMDKVPESIFVYGKKVDDFRAVNYDYIFSTGIGAIQELSKQNEELKMINVELK
ncbi:MAG: DUF4082 domain-containing protein, partial [Bacteroidetes bacterium]|nr:DUF4082 domain-containing protein [Bacteroidota bacterium]MBT7490568.1 DUF4082 domain-containing protein [Bacteroidota bacterium]